MIPIEALNDWYSEEIKKYSSERDKFLTVPPMPDWDDPKFNYALGGLNATRDVLMGLRAFVLTVVSDLAGKLEPLDGD
jgi:hypothetical protein